MTVNDREMKWNFQSGLQWKNFNVIAYHNINILTIIIGQIWLERKTRWFFYFMGQKMHTVFLFHLVVSVVS